MYGLSVLAKSILWESDTLYLTPSPGTLTTGYLILAPKMHYTSFAQIPSDLLQISWRIVERVRELGQEIGYYSYVLFEHGSGSGHRRGASCIEHAHLHLVPSPNPNQLRESLRSRYDEVLLNAFDELATLDSDWPYVFLATSGSYYSYATNNIESQFLRRCIAKQFQVDNRWNWKKYPMRTNYLATLEAFSGKITLS